VVVLTGSTYRGNQKSLAPRTADPTPSQRTHRSMIISGEVGADVIEMCNDDEVHFRGV
jgi:hypothetical protein